MTYFFNTQHIQGKEQSESGFTMLLAALVASSVLSIGAAAYSIAFKQVKLSAVGRDSQFAFYAADSAAECALFADFRTDLSGGKSFATSTDSDSANSLVNVTCDQKVSTLYTVAETARAATTTFYVASSFVDEDGNSRGRCAQVIIAKSYNSVTRGINTRIHADGYSTVVSGDAAAQLDACTPIASSITGNPPPIPEAVQTDANPLQRSVEYKY